LVDVQKKKIGLCVLRISVAGVVTGSTPKDESALSDLAFFFSFFSGAGVVTGTSPKDGSGLTDLPSNVLVVDACILLLIHLTHVSS
jgi:hypothetical protein